MTILRSRARALAPLALVLSLAPLALVLSLVPLALVLSLALASCAGAPDPAHWNQCVNGAFCPADTTCSEDGLRCLPLTSDGDDAAEATRPLCTCELSGDEECDDPAPDDVGPPCRKKVPPPP